MMSKGQIERLVNWGGLVLSTYRKVEREESVDLLLTTHSSLLTAYL